MIYHINIIITMVCITLIYFVYFYFIRRTLLDAKKFEFYRIRDELAMLAMSGKVSENDFQYNFLMRNINYTINFVGSEFRLSEFINILLKSQLQDKKRFNEILELALENKVLLPTYFQFFVELRKVVDQELKLFMYIARIISNKKINRKQKIINSHNKDLIEPALKNNPIDFQEPAFA